MNASLTASLASLPPLQRQQFLASLNPAEWAELEEDSRRLIRSDFQSFCVEAQAPTGEYPAAHHRLLIRHLQAVADGKIRRLMVLMPPGSAKSRYASTLFPVWFLNRRPNLSLIGASHTADLAELFSARVMTVIRDNADVLNYRLATESVQSWRTTTGGEYKAAGVGGPITGRRADIAIIDDPVKSRQDAESETVRERTWNWFISDLRTRLKPASAIVLIMTRWHESDLGGLLEKQQPGLWTILKLPAIAEENDPLGRQIGEWLWSDDAYDYASELKALCSEFETNGATREWAALYQQRPRPTEGALFKTGLIIAIDAIPSGATFIRAWDLAATAQVGTRDPDWTVGLKLARLPDGRWIVADVARDRLDPSGVEKMILATASQDGPTVKISLPQDPGQAGKSQSRNLAGKLAGYDVHVSREDGDKAVRATAVAAQCGVGNLLVLKAPWNAVFLDELSGFPSASKDDQVDALSRAFNVLNSGPPKPKIVMPFVAGVQRVWPGNPSYAAGTDME